MKCLGRSEKWRKRRSFHVPQCTGRKIPLDICASERNFLMYRHVLDARAGSTNVHRIIMNDSGERIFNYQFEAFEGIFRAADQAHLCVVLISTTTTTMIVVAHHHRRDGLWKRRRQRQKLSSQRTERNCFWKKLRLSFLLAQKSCQDYSWPTAERGRQTPEGHHPFVLPCPSRSSWNKQHHQKGL